MEKKPSDDRLAFENICKEKVKTIDEHQLTMARYQKELMARRRCIEPSPTLPSGPSSCPSPLLFPRRRRLSPNLHHQRCPLPQPRNTSPPSVSLEFQTPTTQPTSPHALIMLAIFLLTFLLPFLRSLGRPASEDIHSRQVAIEILPEVGVVSREANFEDRRRQW